MRVIVYSKPACPQCSATVRALTSAGIPFEKIDVTVDAVALEHILTKGFLAAPVVETETDIWSGFRPDKIAELTSQLTAAA